MTKKTDPAERPEGPAESAREERRLGLQLRADVRLMPETVDVEARTVELVWSTGATVRRRDYWTGKPYDEVLSLEAGHVDLSRLNGGAPLLNTHGAHDLGQVLGVVERAWVETGEAGAQGRARVRFSARADVEPIWRDVEAGIIRNVSVGYSVRRFEITEQEGQVPIWRAVDWQPMELSAVPVGADAAAGFRGSGVPEIFCQLERATLLKPSQQYTETDQAVIDQEKDKTMDEQIETPVARGAMDHGDASEIGRQARVAPAHAAGTAADPLQTATEEQPAAGRAAAAEFVAPHEQRRAIGTSDVAEAGRAVVDEPAMRRIAQDAMEGERARIAGIQDAARKLGVGEEITADLVRRGVGLHEARGALIDAAAQNDRAVETRPHIRMGGQCEVDTRRAAVEAALLHRHDPGRFELTAAARDWRGLSLIEMARDILSSEGVRVRGLSRDELATRALHSTSDFPLILSNVTNKTLRAAYETAPRTFAPLARRTTVADFRDVHRLQLGEAPQLEKVNESGEYKRGTLGEAQEKYRIETFGKVIGITRQVLINDDLDAFTRVPALFGTAAATLESDVVWGVITANAAMADGKALFHAGHNNLAATGVKLDVAGLAKARTAMSLQKGLDGRTVLNIRPAFLVVPTSLELEAEQLLAQNIVPAKSTDVVPGSLRSLTVISEPRLDPGAGAVPWYLMASPAAIDTIEYAYLEGQEGVAMETRMGFDVDGMEIRARLDFGAKAIDWRGLYKNPGVALS
ncbi:prohead protease/major capsid protein fusion protein [Seohaeicola saemankumensis]|uniref:prohead protease/major capsid protein fusion protein n=1 Tax=Seohaeicola saemankumensis TaxID=481181 RepID=UPI0035D0480E